MGQYTTVSRVFPRVTGRVVNGLTGYPGSVVFDGPLINTVPDPKQTTYSYRTSRSSDPDLQIDPNDARVTRNGFASYDPVYDKGHTFWTEKQSVELACPSTYYLERDNYGRTWFTRGPVVPSLYGVNGYPSITAWSATNPEAVGYGQRAIKGSSPLRPNASAGQFIGELFEGLPSLVGLSLLKEKARVGKAAGNEYLNIQFGWRPFISDLRKIATALSRASSVLEQLARDNGRIVRRRFAFPTQVETSAPRPTSVSLYGVYSSARGPYWANLVNPTPTQVFDRTETDIWFSGAYTYAIPTDPSGLDRIRTYALKARVLFGASLTPDVLWELAPWSWLVDWKLAIGNLLSNANAYADDGLVIRYGYLMRHVRKMVFVQSSPQLTNAGTRIPSSFVTLLTERKERIRATPYGFGVQAGGFSATQWTILGALGMTKGPLALWEL